MKKIVLKFWLVSLLTSLVLYIIFRIAIMSTTAAGTGLIDTILYVLDIVLNLGLSAIYLAAMLLCSFTVLLNLMRSIRANYLFSWASFSGLPALLVSILLVMLLFDGYQFKQSSILITLLTFSVVYVVATTVLFLIFRKNINSSFQVANH